MFDIPDALGQRLNSCHRDPEGHTCLCLPGSCLLTTGLFTVGQLLCSVRLSGIRVPLVGMVAAGSQPQVHLLVSWEEVEAKQLPLVKDVTWKLLTSLPPTPMARTQLQTRPSLQARLGKCLLQLGSHVFNKTWGVVSYSCRGKLLQASWLGTHIH